MLGMSEPFAYGLVANVRLCDRGGEVCFVGDLVEAIYSHLARTLFRGIGI